MGRASRSGRHAPKVHARRIARFAFQVACRRCLGIGRGVRGFGTVTADMIDDVPDHSSTDDADVSSLQAAGAASVGSVSGAVAAVRAHPDYRVLQRLPSDPRSDGATQPFRRALFVDAETTGFDAGREAIIEVGMALFGYDEHGRITGIEGTFGALEDPGRPIPPEIVDLTGIRDEDVRGQTIDDAEVTALVSRADLVIAHNASFDRPFFERRFSAFVDKPWACSIHDVPWRSEGLESQKLEYLAYRFGTFYDAHRAVVDCVAGIFVLSRLLPKSGVEAMRALLDAARRSDVRFEAVGAPFERKDALKFRGYRWRNERKVWWKDVDAVAADDERRWLEEVVYAGRSRATERSITAVDRYSERIR